jgi:hypothetical protein
MCSRLRNCMWLQVQLPLCLSFTQCRHTEWLKIRLLAVLTAAIDEGKRSSSCVSHFSHGKGAPSVCWIGAWVIPKAVLDSDEKYSICIDGCGYQSHLWAWRTLLHHSKQVCPSGNVSGLNLGVARSESCHGHQLTRRGFLDKCFDNTTN